jgi:integrase
VALYSGLKAAVHQGFVARNVCDLVKLPRRVRRQMQVWSIEEARRFLCWVAEHVPSRYALYTLALATGMRQGELLALTWRRVDLRRGTVQVASGLSRVRGADYVNDPKTEKGRRSIVVDARVVAIVRAHRAEQHLQRPQAGSAWRDRDLVFGEENGEFLLGGGVRHRFARDVAGAGVPATRFHDMRYTAATMALSQGMDTLSISEMLGHVSVATTLNLYGHVQPDMQKRLSDGMAWCLFG